MKRTVDTAKIIAKKINYTKEIEYNKLFIERSFGKLIAGIKFKQLYNIPVIGEKLKQYHNQIDNLSFLDKRTNKRNDIDDKIFKLTKGEDNIQYDKRLSEIINYIKTYINKS